jgi:GTP-binding protein
MKINSAEFVVSAKDFAACPRSALPEFAFIGRSNVGKSSLINLLTGRHDLARTSATPGKTVLMNFFRVNGTWMLVDLPGYGFAKVARSEREEFGQAVADYLEERENLACVFVLIDSRLEPQKIDLRFIEYLDEQEVAFALVFTKSDKQSAAQTQRAVDTFLAAVRPFCEEMPAHFLTSTRTGKGRHELLSAIAKLSVTS